MAFGTPGPSAELRVNRPTLVWEVWGKGTSEVTDWKMTLNGQEVKASYDPEKRLLYYEPEEPLSPGVYKATAHVTVARVLPKDVAWSFSVRPDATSELPPISPVQAAAGDALNEIRASASLPPLHLDPRLCAGAQGHAHYMAANRMITHSEKSSGSEFLGVDPEARVGAYGYAGSVYESVAYASNEPTSATLRSLFDAPYHRIGLLQPATLAVGTGAEKGFIAVDTALGHSGTLVSYPGPGQELPRGAWEANEEPNPLTAHGMKGGPKVFVGYPIVIASFSREAHVQTGKAGLKGAMGAVECLLNTPDRDGYLQDAIILIPKKPLPPGTYSAWSEVSFDNGDVKRLDWTFRVKG
jgi:uncharacterized protein YkwD